MNDTDIAAISRIASRRRIDGMTRRDVRQEAITAYLEAEAKGKTPDQCLRRADNRLINLGKRKTQPQPHPDEEWNPADPLTPDGVLESVIETEGFERLLSGLTDREKEILRLTYQHDGTDEEIAEALGYKSTRTLQAARCKALSKLRIQK